MTFSPSIGAIAPSKPYSSFSPFPQPVLAGGLIQHELFSAATQLTMLRVVDETGSATLGDITDALAGHPDPTGAALVMVDLGILTITFTGIIDMHAVLRRAPQVPDPDDSCAVASDDTSRTKPIASAAMPDGVVTLAASPFSPSVLVANGDARRVLGKIDALDRPGVYALISSDQVYIGASSAVGSRVSSGQQPIGNIETIVVITDANGTLTSHDVLAVERMFHARVQASGAFSRLNDLPMGSGVGPELYSQIDAFLGHACLALHHHGVIFGGNTARAVLAGPRCEAGRLGKPRPFNAIPDGERLELCFDDGLVALATRQQDNRWLLLAGSDIRIETAPSANSSVRFQRSAWLHAGLLELSPDGRSYVTTRDLVFRSGSGAAQFCVGSKGRTRDSWVPIDPNGGFDAGTPALIAA